MWLNKIQRTVEQSEDNTPTEEYGMILNNIKTNNIDETGQIADWSPSDVKKMGNTMNFSPIINKKETNNGSVLANRRAMRKYQYAHMNARKCKPYGIIAEGEKKGCLVVMYNGRNYIIE